MHRRQALAVGEWQLSATVYTECAEQVELCHMQFSGTAWMRRRRLERFSVAQCQRPRKQLKAHCVSWDWHFSSERHSSLTRRLAGERHYACARHCAFHCIMRHCSHAPSAAIVVRRQVRVRLECLSLLRVPIPADAVRFQLLPWPLTLSNRNLSKRRRLIQAVPENCM